MLRIFTSWRRGFEWGCRFTLNRCDHLIRLRLRVRPFAVFRQWRVTPIGWTLVQGVEADGRRWLEWRPSGADVFTRDTRKWL